jgi:hypothetical protein
MDLPLTHEWRMETPRSHAGGIKVRDFAYEPLLNSCRVSEVFDRDPVPSPITTDWHMRNPTNYGLLIPKALFHHIKLG